MMMMNVGIDLCRKVKVGEDHLEMVGEGDWYCFIMIMHPTYVCHA